MRIAVVGAGLSGLRAADLLRQGGADVHVFEAKDRVGGRVWTVQDWNYEAGGEWIDSDHHRLIGLIAELGLTLEKAPGKRGGVWRGEYRSKEDLWADAQQAEDRFWDLAGSHGAKEGETLADLIRLASDSERGRWWLTANLRSDEGVDPDQIGLDAWLAFYRQYQGREGGEVSAYRVAEGMGSLCDRLASRLDGRVNLEAPIRSICLDGAKLLVDGTEFDEVVLAVPPPCLRNISFDPPLPDDVVEAYERVGMAPIVKVVWRMDQNREGNTLWDTPLQQTWNGSRGDKPILTAYICGKDAADLTSRGEEALYEIESWDVKEYQGRRMHDWTSDPWAGGGFTYMPVGFLPLKEHLSKAVGRVHFVGEHTAEWMGFLEGCLESAERVVTEILPPALRKAG